MNLLSKKMLLSNPKYKLTVVTTPTSAVCKISANGETITAKNITAERGTSISVTVTYTNTTSKTYSLILNKNTTLSFTRKSTSTTVLNNNYTRYGTGSEDIVVSGSYNTASGFKTYGSLRLTAAETTVNCNSFEWKVYFTLPSSLSATNDRVIIGDWLQYNSGGTIYSANTSLVLTSARKLALKRGSSGSSSSSPWLITTNALSLSSSYTATAGWDGSTYYISCNGEYVEKSSTSKPFYYAVDDVIYTHVGNCARGSALTSGSPNRPFEGSIRLRDISVYYDDSLVWKGTKTTTSYYFEVSET